MFTMSRILVPLLAVVLFAGAVVSIYDPHHPEAGKSYRRDAHIARQLQRHRPSSHRFNNQPRLSSAAYRHGADVEQQERHASRARPGWDYANNIDQHYEGCPSQFTGLQPYPYDCRRFVNCWKGRAYIQSCGPGTVFNDQTLECDNPSKVVCRGLNAREYQMASNNRVGRLQSATAEISCPTGLTGLLPHPHDCSKFLNCANGAVFVLNCGPQTMFNPKIDACDFAYNVDCSGRSSGSPPQSEPAGNRGGKTIEIGGWGSQALNHHGSHRKGGPHLHSPPPGHTHHHHHHRGYHSPTLTSVPTTSTTTVPTPIFHRDRWTNMNRTRPSAYGNATTLSSDRSTIKTSQQLPPPRWTTTPRPTSPIYGSHGSSGSRTTPAFTSSNYPKTNTTSTTTVYYAQPVDEDLPSEEIFAQVYGADVQEISLPSDRRSASRGGWLPSVSHSGPPSPQQHSTDTIRTPSLNLMPPLPDTQAPLPEEFPPFGTPQSVPSYKPRDSPPPRFGVPQSSPSNSREIPDDDGQAPIPDQFSDFSLSQATFFRPPPPGKSDDHFKTEDHPSAKDWQLEVPNTYFTDSNPPSLPPGNHDYPDSFHIVPDESNLWGGMLPPPPPPSDTRPVGQRPAFSKPESYPAHVDEFPPSSQPQQPKESEYTPLPPPSAATPSYQPAGVKTKPHIDQINPPPAVQNAITRVHASPFYSPSYSGISHSRDSKTLSVSPSRTYSAPRYPLTTTTTTTTERSIEPEITFSRDEGVVLSAPHHPTTVQHHGVLPPSYNREFYKQTTPVPAQERSFDSEESDEVGQLPISEAIRLLLRPYFNRSGTVTDEMASDAESHIMSLAKSKEPTTTRRSTTTSTSTSTTSTTTTTTSTTVAPPVHKDVELVFTGEQEGMSRSPSRPNHSHDHPPSKYHQHQHSRDFHRTRPHLPNPFENESREDEAGDKIDPSVVDVCEFDCGNGKCIKELEVCDGVAQCDNRRDEQKCDDLGFEIRISNGDGGRVEVKIDPSVVDVCEFDCGNGKCIKELEVCDGVAQCDNRRDEQKCDHLGYEIRLSNGDGGRVEVKLFGKWGYVCDDKFGILDANVVCRELGFPLGASEVRGNSYYAPEEGRNVTFVMDELDCKGTENSLKECPFQGWGVSDCGPDEVVGIQCKTTTMKCPNNYWLCKTSNECIPVDFLCDNVPDCSDASDESSAVCNATVEYRLKGGKSKHEGRLEVLYRSVWGTVCDDDFSQNEAQVACNSLGFYGKAKIVKNAFGPGTGPIWLDQVSCVGNESAIDSCAHWAWGEHNCNHTEDVSLKCSTGSLPNVPKLESRSTEEMQTQFEDIGIEFEQMERSSKFKPNRRTCGRFNANLTEEKPLEFERVVRGNIAKRGHHPWQATIRTKGLGGISSHWCGAVLISKKHLVTAAHCLVGYPKGAYFIRLGDHIANIAESSEIDSYIEDWYVHEKFREGTHMNNDIAMIVLKNPVRFNDYVQPICLPQAGTQYEEGRMCTISGWGSIQSGVSTPSNNLRAAQIPVMSDETCRLPHVYGNLITDGMFCAGFLDEGVDACEGDSGGPFVCSDSGTETLYGIISWGKQCGHSNKPGVYVRIEKYIDWIYGKIRLSMQQN